MSWPRFLAADASAAITWAAYACILGSIGGAAFESTWTAVLLALGMAAVLTIGLELVRRLRSRR
jgi:membrane protein DedA with SNARE-associated domain